MGQGEAHPSHYPRAAWALQTLGSSCEAEPERGRGPRLLRLSQWLDAVRGAQDGMGTAWCFKGAQRRYQRRPGGVGSLR